MEKRIISFSPPDISELEITEVVEALRSGWITTGSRTKMLECRLAAYTETGCLILIVLLKKQLLSTARKLCV